MAQYDNPHAAAVSRIGVRGNLYKVLAMCVEKGMVSGHTQGIDSAPVKANASMDALELKVPEGELD